MSDPMPTILDTFAGENAIRKLELDTARDDLVDLFESDAERTDENDHILIRVDVAVQLLVDHPDLVAAVLVASVRPEPTESAN